MLKRFVKDESGQVIVLTLLCAAMLMGFLGLAIDVSLLFRARRNVQIAADSAATAGAQAYMDYSYDPNQADTLANWITNAAQNASALNGIQNGTNGAAVVVNIAPNITTGYHTGAGYVEAIVSQPNPTIFMSAFSHMLGGNNFSTINVTARAVAGEPGSSQACIFVLSPHACPAMDLQGSFTVTAAKCGIVVDSDCKTGALNFTGAGGTLTAGWIGVDGSVSGQSRDSTPAPVTGIVPVTNPFQGIVPPDPTKLSCTAGGKLTGNVGTQGATTCYSGDVELSNATLGGTLVFTGNVTLDGTINTQGLDGNNKPVGNGGVTLDLNSGALNENTGTTMNIVAPTDTTNPYANIALLAPVTNTSTMEFDKGASGGTFSGIIDTPGAELFLHDSGGDKNGGLTINADLVVGTLEDQTATFTVNSYSATHPGATQLLSVSLVE
jgi:Flp pilus assembly protein TadG